MYLKHVLILRMLVKCTGLSLLNTSRGMIPLWKFLENPLTKIYP